ncbi:alkaline phosphatase [Labilibacter sediminis]|nr:alkaline phosphatase [Labilibacter sediminis]
MKLNVLQVILLLCLIPISTVWGQENYKEKDTKFDFQNENFYEVKMYSSDELKFKKKPKNVILLIGDGMGVSQVFAGITANKGQLNLLNFKNIGFSKTQSANNYVTDSAAGGTALSSGVKTKNGAIGVDPEGNPVETILEIAEKNDKVTGLVSTSAITHATPASFIAHQLKRKMYEEIAADFLKTDIDVFIGGGKDFFDARKDKRDLTKELEDKGYQMYYDIDDAANVTSGKLGVLTAAAHNPDFSERGELLVKSTEKAIQILSNSDKGFFLMVEGSQIDWGGHQNNTSYVTGEMLDFDKTIGEVLEFAVKDKETLVIVTADHETGGMALLKSDMDKGFVKAAYATGGHTGVMVPVFAIGPGAEEFTGIYENTEVFEKMLKAFGFEK